MVILKFHTVQMLLQAVRNLVKQKKNQANVSFFFTGKIWRHFLITSQLRKGPFLHGGLIYGNKLVNKIETKPLCASSLNLADILTMWENKPYWFWRSQVKGEGHDGHHWRMLVYGDAMLCIVTVIVFCFCILYTGKILPPFYFRPLGPLTWGRI